MCVCDQENVLEELLRLLKLEKIEENIFRGQSQDLGFGNVFGGQVMGQALSAASRTVSPDRAAHSLHAYFMRPGDPARPIVYTVDCIRDGKSFTTRRVVAVQKGHAIFSLSASFHTDEPGFEHQDDMPENIPGPDGLESEIETAQRLADRIPPGVREKLLCPKPIEIRHINPVDPFAPEKMPPKKYVWFRTTGKIPDDRAAHRYLLLYASDFNLVPTALYPHGHTFWEPDMQMVSLDHAMWFHREFRMDDWLLYVMTSPSAGKARGMALGKIFTRTGQLIASVAQEGLIRWHGMKRQAG